MSEREPLLPNNLTPEDSDLSGQGAPDPHDDHLQSVLDWESPTAPLRAPENPHIPAQCRENLDGLTHVEASALILAVPSIRFTVLFEELE